MVAVFWGGSGGRCFRVVRQVVLYGGYRVVAVMVVLWGGSGGSAVLIHLLLSVSEILPVHWLPSC